MSITISGCGVKEIDLSGTNINPSNLYKINLNYNEISKLSNNVFSHDPNLRYLNLSHNCIEIIEPSFFTPSITTLDLSYNKMKVFPVAGLKTQLITIDLSYNEITEISNNQLENFENLNHLYLSHNNIKTFETTTTNIIETLDLSYNNINYITSSGFEWLEFLKELYLGENNLQKMDSQIFLKNKYLQHLDLSNNPLNSTELSVSSISSLKLKENIFNIAKIKVFKKLIYLDVSMTNSSIIPIDTFTYNVDLEFLNLSYNKIEVLHTGTFTKLSKLHSLDLSGNNLQSLQSGLFQQNPLLYLSVANNRLVSFNMESLNHRITPDLIDLDNNLWSCNTLTKIIHHLEVVSKTKIVSDGNHFSEPNIRGNLCTLNSTETETNVTIQQVLVEIIRDFRDYLEDQEEINKMMIQVFASSKNNSFQNNVAIENKTVPILRINTDIDSAPLTDKTENYVFVKSSILIWLLSIQIIFMLLITSVLIYYLKFRRFSVINNATLLDDMN